MEVAPTRDELVVRAKLAEKVERYEDLKFVMKLLVETGTELSNDERNALSTGYRHYMSKSNFRRSSWRAISSVEQKDEDLTEEKQDMIRDYREKIENEIRETTAEVTMLVDKYLMKNATETEAKVFYLKMKGDYNRYLAEVEADPDKRKKVVSTAEKSYKVAREMATESLKSVHPIRLGISLNYSVFTYEIRAGYKKAINIAKEAFEDALKQLDLLHQESYKDSCIILQLLRDNIHTWTSSEGKDEDLLRTE